MDPGGGNYYTQSNEGGFVRLSRALLLAGLAMTAAPISEAAWLTAYYAGWRQKNLRPQDIDFSVITHLIHFSVIPTKFGGVDPGPNMMTPANIAATVACAHDAGKRILFTVGGQSSRTLFESAMSDAHRAAFVDNLVRFMQDHGYDGIDIDMEDVTRADARDFVKFVRALRGRLDAIKPRPLLTAAALWEPALFAQAAADLDQINLMTYNLSGPYPGWVTWHSGAVYDGGRHFPERAIPLPSTDGLVSAFVAAGVPREKLGIGMSMNGYVWSGGEVDAPGQSWRHRPAMKDYPYYRLAQMYGIEENDYSLPSYRWDAKAQAPYLSIKGSSPEERTFVSYENEVSARRKIEYVRAKGLGGFFVWGLGDGYRKERPDGQRDALLQAVKKAWSTLGSAAPQGKRDEHSTSYSHTGRGLGKENEHEASQGRESGPFSPANSLRP